MISHLDLKYSMFHCGVLTGEDSFILRIMKGLVYVGDDIKTTFDSLIRSTDWKTSFSRTAFRDKADLYSK